MICYAKKSHASLGMSRAEKIRPKSPSVSPPSHRPPHLTPGQETMEIHGLRLKHRRGSQLLMFFFSFGVHGQQYYFMAKFHEWLSMASTKISVMKVPTCRFGIIGFVASPGAFDNCHFLRGLESRTCCKICKSSNQPGSRVAQQNSAIDLGPIGPSHKMVVTAKHGTASNPYHIRYRYRWVLKSSKISPNSS